MREYIFFKCRPNLFNLNEEIYRNTYFTRKKCFLKGETSKRRISTLLKLK